MLRMQIPNPIPSQGRLLFQLYSSRVGVVKHNEKVMTYF
jgi:hypothetical protein